jgi:uncharacterized coiled-coil protein SlyX
MEWLKRLLGEENYKKLVETGMLEVLKESMGETEYVANDPTKIIPKHVFNEKNDRVKMLETQVSEYEKQIKGISGMVTDTDLKTKLAEQENKFRLEMKNQETIYNTQIEKKNKEFLLTNLLINEGAKHIDLLIKAINLDDVIIADNTIVNHEKVISPMKETYKELFKPSMVTGQTPPKGSVQTPVSNREELVKQYETALNAGNPSFLKIQRQIEALDAQTQK